MGEPRTILLRLMYDGGPFHGWQVQPGQPTVQQAMTDAVEAVTGERVVVHASGRTDAGVHALGQAVHIEIASPIPSPQLLKALNARLPLEIRVWEATDMPSGFHARRDALSKLYRYRMYRVPVCPPFVARYVHHYPYPLDEAAMAAAATRFVGEHDFRSFAATGLGGEPEVVSTIRTVLSSRFERLGPELIYEVSGRGFLHHMVRNLVGFLIEVGRGTRRGDEVEAVLAARIRAAAGATAPAKGLVLVAVEYGGTPAEKRA